jgi:hypothetical protein
MRMRDIEEDTKPRTQLREADYESVVINEIKVYNSSSGPYEFLDIEFAPANSDESSDPVSEAPQGVGGFRRQPRTFPTPTYWSQEDKRWIESAPPVNSADAVGLIVLFSGWESGHRGNASTGKSPYEMSVKQGRSEFAKWKKAVSDGIHYFV